MNLLTDSEWRTLPHSQLVQTARQLSLLEPVLYFSFPFVDQVLKQLLSEDLGRQEIFNVINLCSEPNLSTKRKVFVMLRLQKQIKQAISVEDSESQINLLVWYYGQYVQVMSFKGGESCLHYLDREMFEKTV